MAKRKPLIALGRYLRFVGTRPGRRLAIVRGQDSGRWTDIYHLALIAPWSLFFFGLALIFVGINALFALLFMADPYGLVNARAGNFWDAFRFSVQPMGVQSIGSIGTGSI